jgi:dynein heavy chain
MPEVDPYGTVQPHTLLRQHFDYKHWYDRQKLTLKEINNIQYVSCMNPTAGSFTIDPRLLRHFNVFAISMPVQESLATIYHSILSQNFADGFSNQVAKHAMNIVNSVLSLHQKMNTLFLPTAYKFHYVFNLRDLSNIFQGMLFAGPEAVKTLNDLIRLFSHECERVYCDKLVDQEDIDLFFKLQKGIIRKTFEDLIKEDEVFRRPNIYTHFSASVPESRYCAVKDWPHLTKLLTNALDSYNESYAAMNLVLFEDAMLSICKINRILESPIGNALLIGVGGSGKQSLSKLAASMSSLDVFQVTLRSGYIFLLSVPLVFYISIEFYYYNLNIKY